MSSLAEGGRFKAKTFVNLVHTMPQLTRHHNQLLRTVMALLCVTQKPPCNPASSG